MSETPTPPEGAARARRNPAPLIVLGVLVIAGLAFAIYHYAVGVNHAVTDDAYVNGNLVRLTPQVAGTVVAINTDATQFVKQGELLVQLDPRDNDVALAQARANLGQTVREVAQSFANEKRDAATVAAQQVQYTQATQDLERDRSLVAVHGVSAEALQHDQHTQASARAALEQAQATLAATRAAIAGTTPETHPRVQQAEAALRSAWLAAARTKVLAPVSGYVVRRSVQLGQQVTPGSEMLAIVPVDSMWIDANFKENQLRGLRIGQPVDVEADMYGSHVAYHGRVLGVTPGTGSALAVLPAQNASGNWIKIVQRLPVRIGLDPKELSQHPLFLGLSTTVDVDVHDQNGAALSQQAAWPAALNTDVYAVQDQGVEDEIRRIVSANLDQQLAAAPAAAP
ncbi:MAG TPA: HlyD family efflux transporter periplasmic adaptor subunit [Nevskia sp.]|nr:HlyD family efflux transporter periplasmic adaptor subunit [Nevskia sp.]